MWPTEPPRPTEPIPNHGGAGRPIRAASSRSARPSAHHDRAGTELSLTFFRGGRSPTTCPLSAKSRPCSACSKADGHRHGRTERRSTNDLGSYRGSTSAGLRTAAGRTGLDLDAKHGVASGLDARAVAILLRVGGTAEAAAVLAADPAFRTSTDEAVPAHCRAAHRQSCLPNRMRRLCWPSRLQSPARSSI